MNEATSTINLLLPLITGVFPIVLGAVLAIVGGWLGYEIRAKRDDRRELGAMKTTLGDELSSIEGTIRTMHETWTQSQVLYPAYISDLSSSTSSYENLRMRLFLIKDEELRKEIIMFYKKFKDILIKSEGNVGTLAESTEAVAAQTKIHDEFEKLGKDAHELLERLKGQNIS